MIFDTDILIWHLRGHSKAASFVERSREPVISAVTRMELFAGCRDMAEKRQLHAYFQVLSLTAIPLNPEISHRACLLIETYRPGFDLSIPDALIAATAIEQGLTLATGNYRHFRVIKGLDLHRFTIS